MEAYFIALQDETLSEREREREKIVCGDRR
jgi:hypothetical protein